MVGADTLKVGARDAGTVIIFGRGAGEAESGFCRMTKQRPILKSDVLKRWFIRGVNV